MDLKSFFKEVVSLLVKERVRHALAGGLVASLYRDKERITNDLDFLILAGSQTDKKAAGIIRSLGLEPTVIRRADMEGGPPFVVKRYRSPPCIVAGRAEKGSSRIGLDFILPDMPWFESALVRAEQNGVDFGFGAVPCLTVEDLVIAKFYSLKNDAGRFNDLDDLKSIFEANHDLDLAYLCGQMRRLNLVVPKALKAYAPRPLCLVSRRMK